MSGDPTPMQSSGGSRRHVEQLPNSRVSSSIRLCTTPDLSSATRLGLESLSDIKEYHGFVSEDEVMDDDVSEGEECVASTTVPLTAEEVTEPQPSPPSQHWKIPKPCAVCHRSFSDESILINHLSTSHKGQSYSNHLTRQRRYGRSNLLTSASTGSLPNIPAVQSPQLPDGIVLREGTVARTGALVGRNRSPVKTDAGTSRGQNCAPRSRVCVVCLEEEARTVFLPCRHGVCCAACASRLENCPACRRCILYKIDVFFA